MKKYLALLFACLMLLSLAACGGGSSSADASSSSESTSESDSQETAPEENIKEEPVSFEISEYGYGIEDGYLFISAVLHNPSDKVIELPGFCVTAKDSSGSILGTGDQICNILYPGQSYCYSGQMFDVGENPSEVSVEPIPPQDYNIRDISQVDNPNFTDFEVSNVSVKQDSFSSKITGEVTNPNEFDYDMICVSVAFRNANGELTGGTCGFVNSVPAKSTVPFEISLYMPSLVTDTYEVCAFPW